ncbi:MAG: methylmalonyl-CoA mutase family protein, partial [Thermodesulfobacteriota bacterium]|nr:methylmalonyl-CoA mutase family protein [Thermodesulfobacteriota bacterium]
MFTEETLKKARAMAEQWQRDVQRMSGGVVDQEEASTSSGIRLKPVYGPLDVADLDIASLAFPGQFPFARGNYPIHYQVEPMYINHGYGLANAEETRRRREWLGRLGSRWKGDQVTAIIAMDLPSQRGLDPDDPAAAGKVGECG